MGFNNSLEFASKYASELDKIAVQESVTGFFADNVMKAQFVGTKTVVVPDMDFVGLGDYDRENGFPQGAITVTQTSYELKNDRGRELQLDRMDMDETGIANLAGQTLKEFVRTQVVPEMDAYNISKLAKLAIGKNETAFDGSKVYEIFNKMAVNVQAKAGFNEPLVAFVDPAAYSALMSSPEVSRMVTISDFSKGGIDTKVKTINDIAIIPVSAGRMKTNFTASATGFEVGGSNIRILMLPKNAASLVKKTEALRIFTPEQNQSADAYLFQYRLYYDLFVKKSKTDFVQVSTDVAAD